VKASAPPARSEVYSAVKLNRISVEGKKKGLFRVVIETTRGSRNKFSYDPDEGVMMLKKVLPEGHVFPFDFGFVPGTKGGDGDPLDVLVIMDEPTFAGCVVECRLIGVLEAKQEEDGKMIRNDRIIAIAASSLNFQAYDDVDELPKNVCQQIEHFFVSYNEMAGKKFKPLRLSGARAAMRMVEKAGTE
jgi:inorganic pyrophosphatase